MSRLVKFEDVKIIQSPLDPQSYKYIRLDNGLQAVLISTKKKFHPLTVNPKTCVFKEVEEFNGKYIKGRREFSRGSSEMSIEDEECGEEMEMEDKVKNEDDENDFGEVPEENISVVLVVGAGSYNDPPEYPGMAHFCEHSVFLGSKKFRGNFFESCMNAFIKSNAMTDVERTLYLLDGPAIALEQALDIMADSISYPTFDEETLLKEIEVVDNEFIIRKPQDSIRLLHLFNSFAPDGHPVRNFLVGSLKTLKRPGVVQRLRQWKEEHYLPRFMTLAMKAPYGLKKLEDLTIKYFGPMPPGIDRNSPRTDIAMQFPYSVTTSEKFNKFYKVVPCNNLNVLLISWLFPASEWEENLRSKPMELLAYILNNRGKGSLGEFLRKENLATSIIGGTIRESIFQNQFFTFFAIMAEVTPEGMRQVSFMIDIIFAYISWMKHLNSDVLEGKFIELVKVKEKEFHYKVVPEVKAIAEVLHLRSLERERVVLDTNIPTEYDEEATRRILDGLIPQTANFILGSQRFKHPGNLFEKYHGVRYNRVPVPPEVMHGWIHPCEKLMNEFKIPTPNKYIAKDLFCTKGCGGERKNQYMEKNKMAVFYANDPLVSGHMPLAKYKFSFNSGRASTDKATYMALSMIWIWVLYSELSYRMADAVDAGISFDWSWEKCNKLMATVEGPSQCIFDCVLSIFEVFQKSDQIIKVPMFESFRSLCACSFENMEMENPKYAHDITNKMVFENHATYSESSIATQALTLEKYIDFVKRFQQSMYVTCELNGNVPKDHFECVIKEVKKIEFMPLGPNAMQKERSIPLPKGETVIVRPSKNPEVHMSVVCNYYQIGEVSEHVQLIAKKVVKTLSSRLYLKMRNDDRITYTPCAKFETVNGSSGIIIELNTPSDRFSTKFVNEKIEEFLIDLLAQEKKKPFVDDYCVLLFKKHLLRTGKGFRKLSVQIVASKSEEDEYPCIELYPNPNPFFEMSGDCQVRSPSNDLPFPEPVNPSLAPFLSRDFSGLGFYNSHQDEL